MSDPYERAEQEKRRAQEPPKPKPTGYEQAEREKERAQTTKKPRKSTTSTKTQPTKTTAKTITSTTKPVVIMDLTKEINQLKNDTIRLQTQADLTKLQIHDIRQMGKEIKKAHQLIISGKVNQRQIKKIKETIKKIEKVKDEIENPPRGSWYGERETIDFQEIIQEFYDKSNFPSKAEMKRAFKEKGLVAAKEEFKPKSLGEALSRAAYLVTEMIGGGVREATFGATGSMGAEKRRGGTAIQIAGGLATPTVLDYAAGYALTKIAPLKRGRQLIKKLNDYMYPENMWANKQMAAKAAKALEALKGTSGWSTTEIRNLKKAIKTLDMKQAKRIMTFDEWDELNKLAKESEKLVGSSGISTYDLRKLKSAVKKLVIVTDDTGLPLEAFTPEQARQFEKLMNKQGISTEELRYASRERLKRLMKEAIDFYEKNPHATRTTDVIEQFDKYAWENWDLDEYVNFLKKYGDELNPDILASVLINLPFDDTALILEDVADYNIDKYRDRPDTFLAERKKLTEKTGEEETPKETPEEEPDETPIPIPPGQKPKQTPDEIQKPMPDQTQEPAPEEPTPPPETPPVILSAKDKEALRRNRLRLFNGPKAMFKVVFKFPRGIGQTISIEARSFVEALNKAQRERRSNKHHPNLVDITRIRR